MMTIQFSPKSGMIRQFIEKFRPWIEGQLGVSVSDMIQLRFDHDISMIAASKLLPGVKFSGHEKGVERLFEDRLMDVAFPPDGLPALSMTLIPDEASSFASGEKLWRAHWLDCPVAIHLRGLTSPIVVINVPFVVGGNGGGEWREIVLVRRDSAEDILALAKQASAAILEPNLHFHGNGMEKVRPT